jgi:hypothetical protein
MQRQTGEVERGNGEVDEGRGEGERGNGEVDEARGEGERGNDEVDEGKGEGERGSGEVPAEPSKAMQMTLPRRVTERMCLPASDSSGGVTVLRATGERTVAPATSLPASARRSLSLVTSSSGSSGTIEDRRCCAGRQTLQPAHDDARPWIEIPLDARLVTVRMAERVPRAAQWLSSRQSSRR